MYLDGTSTRFLIKYTPAMESPLSPFLFSFTCSGFSIWGREKHRVSATASPPPVVTNNDIIEWQKIPDRIYHALGMRGRLSTTVINTSACTRGEFMPRNILGISALLSLTPAWSVKKRKRRERERERERERDAAGDLKSGLKSRWLELNLC